MQHALKGQLASIFVAMLALPSVTMAQAPGDYPPLEYAGLSDLTGLARVLGELHAIRVSCAGVSDQSFRRQMQAVIDREASTPQSGRRSALIDAFNAGYVRGGAGRWICRSDLVEREKALARQGRVLAERIATGYRDQ